MSATITLPGLLWMVLNALERFYIEQGAGTALTPSLDLWANLLRVVDRAGVSSSELPTALRLSKRAVRSRLSLAIRRGWVEELRMAPRGSSVKLTARGSDASLRFASLQSDAEERWRKHAGIDRAEQLRASLEGVVAALPLEHPHYPASYGAADASITGGNGQDWRAVPRSGGDSVSGLATSALLSQAIVAFAIDYEGKSPVALSLSADVINRVPADGLAMREIGHTVGVSALIRHGLLRVTDSQGAETIHLTPKGQSVKAAFRERIRGVEEDWRNTLGHGSVASLRCALEALVLDSSNSSQAS